MGSLGITTSVSTLSLTWEPPFTLDLSGDSDITGYCVDVINSTSSVILYSQCGINETEFGYPVPPNTGCTVYHFTITPVNIVGRGEGSTTSYVESQTSMLYTCICIE